MNICVDTGALRAASASARSQGTTCEMRGRGIDAALRSLDLEIRAREHIDSRLRSLLAKYRSSASALSAHASFLQAAAERYDMTEEGLLSAHKPNPTAAFTMVAGAASWNPDTHDQVIPASVLDFVRAAFGDVVGNEKIADLMADLVAAVPVVGTVLAWEDVIILVQKGDYDAAFWSALTSNKYINAFDKGYKIGEFIAEDLGVSEYYIGKIPGADGWKPNFDTLSNFDKVHETWDAMYEGLSYKANDIGSDVATGVKRTWQQLFD